LGFKSGYVISIPKKEGFEDCYVIYSVFLPSLNKWIWMGAIWDAYVKDCKGAFLSMEEVRE